jgi:superfamily II DNA/RNA helicase
MKNRVDLCSADVLVATPGRLIDLLDNGGVRPRLTQISEYDRNSGLRT